MRVFFKKNQMQKEIDSFKRMQDGLSPASRNGRTDQRGGSTGASTAGPQLSGMSEGVGEPYVAEFAGRAGDHLHSVVSGEATWEGKLRTEASVRIEGTISGEIEAGDTVFIAKGAHARANVHARLVIVAGELEGQINCREQLVVEKSGRLKGEVSTKTIVVQEGAVVQSKIQMLRGNEPAQAMAKESMSREDNASSPLGKTNDHWHLPDQAAGTKTKPVEL